jgi:protein SCO1/2
MDAARELRRALSRRRGARGRRRGGLALCLAGLLVTVTAGAAFDLEAARDASRQAVGRTIGAYGFEDGEGRRVELARLAGRPLVVSLVYTSCYGSCSVLTRRLAQAVAAARDALGADRFTVLTVGFDARADTPARMAAFAREQGVGDANWLILSADEGTARALAADLGFRFELSPRGFDHVTQTTIVDARGRIYRQVYGDAFTTPELVEPLKELVLGEGARASTVAGWIDGLKFLCTVYDPSRDRYRFDYSVVVAALTGLLCLGAVGVFIVRAWVQGRDRHAA